MSERLQQLARWSMSPPLLALVRGEPPHPAFRKFCRPILGNGDPWWALGLDAVASEGPFGGPSVALWGQDFGDGHHSEVVHCDRTDQGFAFWPSGTTDSCSEEDEAPTLIAHTEQGLFFWLFFHLIEDQDMQEERALEMVREAAEAVGFLYLEDCLACQKAVGSQPECHELLLQRSVEV